MNAKTINAQLDKKTNNIVFKKSLPKFKSIKCLGKIIVQYNIWMTGKRKLIKKTDMQKAKARKDLYPFKYIKVLDLKPPLDGLWYWAFFLDKFSKINSPKINIKRKNDNLFAKVRSSNDIHALYIPVVNVDIPKKETDPKSDKVSIATNERPATIAGLAEGSIILKKDFCLEKPMFFPSSIKFSDW